MSGIFQSISDLIESEYRRNKLLQPPFPNINNEHDRLMNSARLGGLICIADLRSDLLPSSSASGFSEVFMGIHDGPPECCLFFKTCHPKAPPGCPSGSSDRSDWKFGGPVVAYASRRPIASFPTLDFSLQKNSGFSPCARPSIPFEELGRNECRLPRTGLKSRQESIGNRLKATATASGIAAPTASFFSRLRFVYR